MNEDAILTAVIDVLLAAGLNAGGFGAIGLSIVLITLVISIVKLSFFRPLWDRLGDNKVLVAPVLSLIPIFHSAFKVADGFSVSGLLLSFTVGPGSIALSKILKALRKKKGVGPVMLGMIKVCELILGGKARKTRGE